MIVLPDADLERAASTAAWGSFFHEGQVFMATRAISSTSRSLRSTPPGWRKRPNACQSATPDRSGSPRPGDRRQAARQDPRPRHGKHRRQSPTRCGRHLRRAVLPADGTRQRHRLLSRVHPGGVRPGRPVRTFSSLDEAAALAADSEYGLSLVILTRDVMKGLELAERIPTGLVHINDQTVNDEALAPFGGVAASGTGFASAVRPTSTPSPRPGGSRSGLRRPCIRFEPYPQVVATSSPALGVSR
jgi:benzaldehyde dehydrogenase (NAD)